MRECHSSIRADRKKANGPQSGSTLNVRWNHAFHATVDGRPYWYMTYGVVNNTNEARTFLPHFELVTTDGQTIPSDRQVLTV